MKKHIAFILALMMLILTACGQTEHSGSTSMPTAQTTLPATQTVETTQPQTMLPTTQQTETTEPTIASTTAPTEPDSALLEEFNASWAYINGGEVCMGWKFTGEPHHNPVFDVVDLTKLVPGHFYLFFFEDDEYVRHELISDKQAGAYSVTSEHVYFTLADELTKVYRTDLSGNDMTLLFESDYPIYSIQYYGTDSKGMLIMAERRPEGDRILSFDIATGETRLLMEAYKIGQFFYYGSSLAADSVVKHISKEELGPVIYWKGRLNENDPEVAMEYTFYFVLSKAEQWDVESWEIAE